MRATFALTLLLGCLSGILAQQANIDSSVSKELVTDCLKENGVTPQDLADLQSGKVKAEDAKDNVKCSSQCILVKSGFMDSTGKLLTDKIKSYYANSNFKDVIEKDLDRCSAVKGANACDTAFKILSCFQAAN
uniref:Odorant-binding protein 56g n=1 Tax=Drosophila melanogaster TaxID=7227 RepID=A1ZBQ4_DROME|nr:Odorant-binding protein 56g, isoform B [Drosophila melanogaster]AAS64797.1 Odorant-binding protein 56g, isoform B [Drosophila melanogaster]ABW78012.1 odorant-binding protein 56g [Drosophila melanogaster]ABW78014.1 odorant-binding protein 56g [Drosophila melanogaster]ABW78015.1 odorant-binding protein 56g [Drosophila melanogaster]ABW78016.1 odorant-binding protein 56g [Drosophila melanogaster]|eukprot:NP_995903.1 Odorant-binding protein 56g, isoform B [Drosophila melanogaster]